MVLPASRRCPATHVALAGPRTMILRCVMSRDHGPRHRDLRDNVWVGEPLTFTRLANGYAATTPTLAYGVYSDFRYWPAARHQTFSWDLEVRDLTRCVGIRHRAAAPLLHRGRYRSRAVAYAVAQAYESLAGDPAARWATAHALAGTPRCDVPLDLAADARGPDPFAAR